MMKNLMSLTILLAALLLAGCGQKVQEEQAAEEAPVEEVAVKSAAMEQPVEAGEVGNRGENVIDICGNTGEV